MEPEIEDGIIVNMLTSLVVCFLISIEREIPPHAKKARSIRKVEEALADLAKLSAIPISPSQSAAGTRLYNRLVQEFQYELEEEFARENAESMGQLSLPGCS